MKLLRVLPIFLIGCCFTAGSFAANDFNNIRKDIKVMNKIIAGAIEADDECKKCNVAVKGSYLAEQGAIFVISTRSSFLKHLGISDDDMDDEDLKFEQLEDLPEMIGGIMSDLGAAIGDLDFDYASDDDHDIHRIYADAESGRQSRLETETRSELRSLRRQMRRQGEEIRDQQMELMYAKDSAKNDLEKTIKGLEENFAEQETKRNDLKAQLDEEQARREQEHKKVMQAAEENRQKRNAVVENLVMDTLCDYGASLKNLPADEKVTLLFERNGRHWADNRTRIYVLNKKDLLACQNNDLDTKGLLERSISYNF